MTAYRFIDVPYLTYYYIFLVLSRIFLFVTHYSAPCSSDVRFFELHFPDVWNETASEQVSPAPRFFCNIHGIVLLINFYLAKLDTTFKETQNGSKPYIQRFTQSALMVFNIFLRTFAFIFYTSLSFIPFTFHALFSITRINADISHRIGNGKFKYSHSRL